MAHHPSIGTSHFPFLLNVNDISRNPEYRRLCKMHLPWVVGFGRAAIPAHSRSPAEAEQKWPFALVLAFRFSLTTTYIDHLG